MTDMNDDVGERIQGGRYIATTDSWTILEWRCKQEAVSSNICTIVTDDGDLQDIFKSIDSKINDIPRESAFVAFLFMGKWVTDRLFGALNYILKCLKENHFNVECFTFQIDKKAMECLAYKKEEKIFREIMRKVGIDLKEGLLNAKEVRFWLDDYLVGALPYCFGWKAEDE